MGVLVDSNVLLDLINRDANWLTWSQEQVLALAAEEALIINPIIYSEISPSFDREYELVNWLAATVFKREDLPWEAAFPAGRAFVKYRQRGGVRRSPLPDFYIGAHAQVAGLTLLTRDGDRYREYFPKVRLICPKS